MTQVAESGRSAAVNARVELHGDWLRVWFPSDGDEPYADFHSRWLRHHGGSERHPTTGERTLCSADLADDLQAVAATVAGNLLELHFSDGATCSVPLTWLRRQAYAPARVAVPPPPSELAPVTLRRDELGEAWVQTALARLTVQGLVIVRASESERRDPEGDTEPLVARLEQAGLQIVGTHFGRIEDLRVDNTTNQNTDQLGYTDSAIELHTDQPFLATPPRYQLLQSIRSGEAGGENFLCDALAAARYLESLEAQEVELLRTTPVRFLRQQKAFTSLTTRPILSVEGSLAAPRAFQVRLSYFTVAPYQTTFAMMNAWYRAHDRFVRLCRAPQHQYRFRLQPGDFVLYDNHRMLHGRSGFVGPRWVRGIYFNPAAPS